jgi:DNA polymerase I
MHGCPRRHQRDAREAWFDPGARPPYPFGEGGRELFIAYAASAETSCFLTLNWPPPPYVLDLYTEFLALRNGAATTDRERFGILDALAYFGMSGLAVDEKHELRGLAMRGPPYTSSEKRELLDYCATDVDALARLLDPLGEAAGLFDVRVLKQALRRGRYMAATASVEATGVPIASGLWRSVVDAWPSIKASLVERHDQYGIFEGTSFREERFVAYLERDGLLGRWPRLDSGHLALDRDTFSDMAKAYPHLLDLHELRKTLGELRLNNLAVGRDGRNRVWLAPFRTKTSRNAPSNARFVFGPAKWIRNMIEPPEGCALAYVDWRSQEIGVAAALSGDEALWSDFLSSDVYLAFAIRAGLAPEGATKRTHPQIRELCKRVVLGVNYGMSAPGLAVRLGVPLSTAHRLLEKHRAAYPRFWAWSDQLADAACVGRTLTTVGGWPLRFPLDSDKINPRTARNFPVQGNAAEMMRDVCVRAVDEGLHVCASVHDAFLIEAPSGEIGDAVATLRRLMGDAGERVLGAGRRVEAEATVVTSPNRYFEERGRALFETVVENVEGGRTAPFENASKTTRTCVANAP